MNFPGGPVAIPAALTCNGTSGKAQLWQPEQPRALDRLTDEQLLTLANDLLNILENETPDTVEPGLKDYIDIVSAQLMGELSRRSF